jgi:hypothetical protein
MSAIWAEHLLFCLFNHCDSTEGAFPGTYPTPFTVVEVYLEIPARINYRLGRAMNPTGTTTFTFLPIQDWTKRTPVTCIHDVEFLS